MYHLASTNQWFNGMKFDSLAEALKKQRKALSLNPHSPCDIMRHEDNKTTKVVKMGPDSNGTTRIMR